MRIALSIFPAVLAVGACVDSGSDYPVKQTQGTVPFGSPPGAGALVGRACFVGDARDLGSCGATGAGGLAVTVGGQTVTTAADGTFTMPSSALSAGGIDTGGAASVTTASVSGDGIVPTTAAIGSPFVIPVIDANLYSQMLAANGIVLESGSGSIIGSVTRGDGTTGAPVSAASTPSPAFGPFYDGSTPTAWTLDGTGARGVVWIPGATAGTNAITFTDGSGGETTVGGVQVVDGGLTIVDAVLP